MSTEILLFFKGQRQEKLCINLCNMRSHRWGPLIYSTDSIALCSQALFFFFKFIYLFLAALGLCCCSRAFSEWGATLRCGAQASHCGGFSCCGAWGLECRLSSCGTWAQQLWLMGSRAQAQQLWRTGLVAPWHVGSSRTRARTHVPCIGRRILNHCATREAPQALLNSQLFSCLSLPLCFCMCCPSFLPGMLILHSLNYLTDGLTGILSFQQCFWSIPLSQGWSVPNQCSCLSGYCHKSTWSRARA